MRTRDYSNSAAGIRSPTGGFACLTSWRMEVAREEHDHDPSLGNYACVHVY